MAIQGRNQMRTKKMFLLLVPENLGINYLWYCTQTPNYVNSSKRIPGLEPGASAWKAEVLPLYDIRRNSRPVGIEPTTCCFGDNRSTTELKAYFLIIF